MDLEAQQDIGKEKEVKRLKEVENERLQLIVKEAEKLSETEKKALAEKEKDRGNEYYGAKEYIEAEKYYSASIAIWPTAKAFNNRAACYLKQCKYAAALSDANSTLALEPDNVKALFRRGVALQHQNKFRGTENKQTAKPRITDYNTWDKYDADTEIVKMDLEAQQDIGKEKEVKRLKEVENERLQLIVKEAEKLSETEKKALAEKEKDRGNEYYGAKEYIKAEKYYSASIAIWPTAKAFNNRAACYLKQCKYAAALSDANSTLALEPDNVKALFRRGVALQHQNKFRGTENVLLDIAIEVAKYLSPRDISSCCAVSRHWREVFGTDQVWKELCDSELEEHLRTTPCVVEPQFSLPEQHCSLAPLSRWRAAYLREQHLWKNWRTGNCKTMEEEMENFKTKTSPELFVTNDLIMVFYGDSIQLWDLKTYPPTQKDKLLLGKRCYYTPRALNNGIIILKGYSEGDFIKIVKVDVAQYTINYKWQVELNSDYSFKLVSSNKKVLNNLDSMNQFDLIITPGGKCIGHFWFCEENDSFYIWDLENGVELRKECCSTRLPEGGLSIVGCKTGSKTCEDILVLLPNTMLPDLPGIVTVTCRVYNVHQLCFLPFEQTFSVFCGFLMGFTQDSFNYCAITDNFLALSDCDIKNPEEVSDVRVYNYRSGHLLHKLPSKGTIQIINDLCFLFKMPKVVKQVTSQRPNSRQMMPQDDKTVLCSVFCPSGAILEDTTGCEVNHFRVFGKGLVEIFSTQVMLRPNLLVNSSTEVWRLNQFSSFKTGVTFPERTDVNRAFTKVITRTDTILEEEDTIRVTYFW
ncbi:uncharacterized protein LOC128999665 [Macrosteles quadrilineatus]|uniref:uncharacterized protein LOC128999665 n=1 Tax=Macrosteles quadrilineatus TaxID=74068 RepID=UPI0023E2A2EA|nr:uncharacterized protein LOC128999665 [Macrosteles quadrilineatus]